MNSLQSGDSLAKSQLHSQSVKYPELQELNIEVDAQHPEEAQELETLVTQIIGYSKHEHAVIHREANRLGNHSHKHQTHAQGSQNTEASQEEVNEPTQTCECCQLSVHTESLSATETNLQELTHIGPATAVYFQMLLNLAALLVVMVLVYGVFTLATNIKIAHETNFDSQVYMTVSSAAKAQRDDNDNFKGRGMHKISSWLGVVMMVVWGIMHYHLKKDLVNVEAKAKTQPTVADYSVLVSSLPQSITKEELERQVNSFLAQCSSQNTQQIHIVKVNEIKPFLLNESQMQDQQLDQLSSKNQQMKSSFTGLLLKRIETGDFNIVKHGRDLLYQQFRQNRRKLLGKLGDLREHILQSIVTAAQKPITQAFITFQTVHQRNIFLRLNPNSSIVKFKKIMPEWMVEPQKRLQIRVGQEVSSELIIQAAPEPQDILWGNFGLTTPSYVCRQCLTLAIGALFLGLSFASAYGLRLRAQQTQSSFLTVLACLSLTLFNMIIVKAIQYTTIYERPNNTHAYQSSLAVKGMLLELVNSIATPISINFMVTGGRIFAKRGLIEEVFILSITTSLLTPVFRVINPTYLYSLARKIYYETPLHRLRVAQHLLNTTLEKPEFQFATNSVNPIGNFMFVCFFASMQPIAAFFSLAGVLLLYWVEKWTLLSRTQRPSAGSQFMNLANQQMLLLGGVLFALGNLTWSVFLPDGSFASSAVPNFITLAIAVVIYIIPYGQMVETPPPNTEETFDEVRMFLSSQYDRMNPATSKPAIKNYKGFLVEKVEQTLKMSEAAQKVIQIRLLSRATIGSYQGVLHSNFLTNNNNQRVRQLFNHLSKNTTNPKRLLSLIWPETYPQWIKQGGPAKDLIFDLVKVHGSNLTFDDIAGQIRRVGQRKILSQAKNMFRDNLPFDQPSHPIKGFLRDIAPKSTNFSLGGLVSQAGRTAQRYLAVEAGKKIGKQIRDKFQENNSVLKPKKEAQNEKQQVESKQMKLQVKSASLEKDEVKQEDNSSKEKEYSNGQQSLKKSDESDDRSLGKKPSSDKVGLLEAKSDDDKQ